MRLMVGLRVVSTGSEGQGGEDKELGILYEIIGVKAREFRGFKK